jgi:hypothetical protein
MSQPSDPEPLEELAASLRLDRYGMTAADLAGESWEDLTALVSLISLADAWDKAYGTRVIPEVSRD